MSGAYPPLSCKDVKRILKNMGFAPRQNKGHIPRAVGKIRIWKNLQSHS